MNETLTYLDNAATTKTLPEVVERMNEVMATAWGNPSSPHVAGRRAADVLEESRAIIADALGAHPDEIYFTSGSTESNNLAVRGACLARRDEPGQIITSSLEHASVTRSVRGMRRDDAWPCSYVEAPDGKLDLDQLRDHLRAAPTTLITMMRVQNEAGWIFPIPEVAGIRDELAPDALLHTDATQAFGKLPVDVNDLGCQLLTAGAHKIGGPRGIGILYVQRGINMFTTAFGGNQERGLRSGTEPVFLAAGMATAVQLAEEHLEENYRHAEALRRRLVAKLHEALPDAIVHAPEGGSPYIASVSIPGVPNARSVHYLSDRGVCVSRASACEENHTTVPAGTWREKHPLSLQAAGIPLREGKQTLRVSFFHQNTAADVDRFVSVLAECARELRGEGA